MGGGGSEATRAPSWLAGRSDHHVPTHVHHGTRRINSSPQKRHLKATNNSTESKNSVRLRLYTLSDNSDRSFSSFQPGTDMAFWAIFIISPPKHFFLRLNKSTCYINDKIKYFTALYLISAISNTITVQST